MTSSRNVDTIATLISTLLDDAPKRSRLRAAARATVVQHFDGRKAARCVHRRSLRVDDEVLIWSSVVRCRLTFGVVRRWVGIIAKVALRFVAVTYADPHPRGAAEFWATLLGRDRVVDADGALVPGEESQIGLRYVVGEAPRPDAHRLHLHLTSSTLEDQRRIVDQALRLGRDTSTWGSSLTRLTSCSPIPVAVFSA